jgi:predicted ATP-grasp superfamily ATP-dependent carboligase
MEEIKILRKIDMRNPVMIAGWPGMGSVALGVVDHLRRKLAATKFAEIKLDPAATVDSVTVEGGLAKLPPTPKNVFYYAAKPGLVICEGEAQLSGQYGVKLLGKVLDLASDIKVKGIYTGAAFPLPISYREEPEVYGAANTKAFLPLFSKLGIKPMEGGHISGLNGLVLGFAAERGIDAACLLATMPQYAISLPNPKASLAIIGALEKILNFKIETQELDEYIKDMDEKMALIEDRVKDVFTIEKEEPESLPAEKKVPGYIMEKVEKLFREARQDRSKAIILKKELDRWDLYKLYEDRFLDLFKESQ